jgi:hypothetical protein
MTRITSKFMIVPHGIILRIRKVSGKGYRENQNTHFIFNNFFLNSVIYEITWKNMVEPDDAIIRPRIDVICMPCRFLCKTCFDIVPISLKLHFCRSVCTINVASSTFTGHAINAVCFLLVITSWCFSHEQSPKDMYFLKTP